MQRRRIDKLPLWVSPSIVAAAACVALRRLAPGVTARP